MQFEQNFGKRKSVIKDFETAAIVLNAIGKSVGDKIEEVERMSYQKTLLKSDGSPVTTADLVGEEEGFEKFDLFDKLREMPVLSEERGGGRLPQLLGDLIESDEYIVFDSVDGTKHKHTGEYCVMLSLMQHGRPVASSIVHPPSGVTYIAWENGGAYRVPLNGGRRMQLHVQSRRYNLTHARSKNARSHLKDIVDGLYRARIIYGKLTSDPYPGCRQGKKLVDGRLYVGSVGLKIVSMVDPDFSRLKIGDQEFMKNFGRRRGHFTFYGPGISLHDTTSPPLTLLEAGGVAGYYDGNPLKFDRLVHPKAIVYAVSKEAYDVLCEFLAPHKDILESTI